MALLTSIAVELQRFIGTSIPQIVDLLKNYNSEVRRVSVEVLSKLFEHGM
jgi:hypothetical protein